jgi:D-arabinose 1-dehydrogenase-like Zn-dependent alcohol dehydrogenase
MILGMEIETVGWYGMQARRYPEMLIMMQAGVINASVLVTEQDSMEGVNDVFERMTGLNMLGFAVLVN